MNEGHDAAKFYFIKQMRRYGHYKVIINESDYIYVKENDNGYLCNIKIDNKSNISFHLTLNDVWKRIRETCNSYNQ
jgi:hypothetical protein